MAKLLLAEQTSVLKIRLEKLIRNLGQYEIITYNGGVVPFDRFFRANEDFQLVIIDIDQFRSAFDWMMDDMKAKAQEGPTRIIALSMDIKLADIASLYSKGVDDVITKPFGDEVIENKLRRYMSNDNQKNMMDMKKKVMGDVRVLKWSTDIELGVEEIDKEHRNMIEHFEKLYILMREGHGHEYYVELLGFLENYVVHHFTHEEELQTRIEYPEYDTHRKLHAEFRKQVESFMPQFGGSQVTNAELIKLNLFIKNWISDHILHEDRKIAVFLAEKS